MRGSVGKVVWAFFVLSVGFAIIGDPTVGGEQFKQNLISKSDSFKVFVDDLTRDVRNGKSGPVGGGADGPNVPASASGSKDTTPPKGAPSSTPKKDLAALNALKTVNTQSGKGYDRDTWRHWIDVRPCWSTRDEVLYRDAVKGSPVLVDKAGRKTTDLKKACGLAAGKWNDPFSKLVFTKPSDLDIDHIVPLENAHRSGAASWSKDKKKAYANSLADPDHLRAVSASANRSKGAQSPAGWQPVDRSKHCWYGRAWVRIKTKWELTITPQEKAAVKDMLSTCSK